MTVAIRLAGETDLPVLRRIEVAAGKAFAEIGMDEVAGDEGLPEEQLRAYQQDGRAWVATDAADHPAAYVLADVVDGNAHIEQVSVDPDHAHQRIGQALIDQVGRWARERGHPALTLTTFVEVAWNLPYYERLGFRRLTTAEVTPGLRTIRDHEASLGLDRWPRCCMLRAL
ncbi:GNAT family N-acetyltransferase [Fodinicola feengrottensis]|nr:GNAT family N-acetyltransferase [Fodinicola feengrottensis]